MVGLIAWLCCLVDKSRQGSTLCWSPIPQIPSTAYIQKFKGRTNVVVTKRLISYLNSPSSYLRVKCYIEKTCMPFE